MEKGGGREESRVREDVSISSNDGRQETQEKKNQINYLRSLEQIDITSMGTFRINKMQCVHCLTYNPKECY